MRTFLAIELPYKLNIYYLFVSLLLFVCFSLCRLVSFVYYLLAICSRECLTKFHCTCGIMTTFIHSFIRREASEHFYRFNT